MENIRLFNLALLLVAVLFVQHSVPAGTESLGNSDSRIAFESSTPAGYTRVTLTDNGIVWGVPTKYTTDSDGGTVAYMVLGKLKGCSFATAEAARQSKVYIKTQALGELDNFASETVCGKTSHPWQTSWDGVRITHLRFFDESSSPNIKEAVYNAATGQIEIPGESPVQQPDPPEQPEEPGNEGGTPSSAQDTLEGHTAEVISVAFSPDGTLLASGSGDNTLKLWDVLRREQIASLEGHTDWVLSVAFSPDGTLLASASLDFTVKLWDVATHANIATLEHIAEVSSVSFSPDGTLLASASVDGTVRLWDVAKKENIASLEHTDGVRSVAFSPDGTLLASGSLVGTLKLWDVVRREQIASLEGHTDMVFSVAFSPDGTLLTSASKDYTFKLWDVAKKENIATHVTGATSVAFSPDGTILAYGAESEAVLLDVAMLLDVKTKEPIFFFEGYPELIVSVFSSHTDWVLSVSFSPDGTLFASALGDNTIKLWDVSEWTGVSPYHLVKISGDDQEGMPGAVLANPLIVEVRDQDDNPLADVEVTFTVTAGNGKLSGQSTIEHATTDADGRAEAILTLGPILGTNTVGVSLGVRTFATFNAVAVGTPDTPSSMDGDYRTWHVPDDVIARLGKGRLGASDRNVAFSPDGQRLAVASGIGVWLYDVETARELALLPTESWLNSVVFSPDGTLLASASGDGTVKLWDMPSRVQVGILEGHTSSVYSVVFSSDGTKLASGSFDDTVKLWDVATGRNIATLEGHTDYVTSVVFSPDGRLLASGSADETVLLWNLATGAVVGAQGGPFGGHFDGHTSGVSSVSFSPDGTMLASASWDNTVKLWHATGRNIATIEGHTSNVYSVVFSPDGTRLASGSRDGTVKLWDVATRETIATLEGDAVSVVFSSDGRLLASASGDGTVKLWDMTTRENIATLEGHASNIYSVVFSPDGTRLASGSYKTVKLWDVATRTNIATLEGHISSVYSVVFSPDGTRLASGWGDATVLLWDVATRENIATLGGHMGSVYSVVFSPDGTRLASGSYDGTILLWDVATYITPSTPTSAPTPDFDGDGTVGFGDFLQFAAQFGLSQGDAGYDARYDLDGDGAIGFGDFLIFANAFGKDA